MEEREETLEERNLRTLGELEARIEDHEEGERIEVIEALTIREQLLQRTKRRIFETPVDMIDDAGDVIGEIVIKTRMMTGAERNEAINLMNALQKMRDEENQDILVYNETTKGVSAILAEIAVDPSVKRYFADQEATDDILVAVLSSSMEQSLEAIGDNLSRFREKRDRPAPA